LGLGLKPTLGPLCNRGFYAPKSFKACKNFIPKRALKVGLDLGMASYSIRGGPLSSTWRRKQPSLTAIEASLSAGLNGSHGGSALAPALVTGSGHSKISEAGIGFANGYWSGSWIWGVV
jgi:hypothetical protein